MADDAKEQVQQQETATEQPHGGEEPDYKALYEKTLAESRKWEQRSKQNAEKAKAYEEAEQAKKSVEERLAELEARNKALEDEKARKDLVAKVAAATGVDEGIVGMLSGADEEALSAQAKAIAKAPMYPQVKDMGGSGKPPKRSTAAQFAEAVGGII